MTNLNEIIGTTIHNSNGDDYVVMAVNIALDRTLLVQNINGKAYYVGAWALQKCADGINYYWGQGHYFFDSFRAASNYVLGLEEK